MLSKDLLCSHVYVNWVSETWGQRNCRWKQYCALYWGTEGLLPRLPHFLPHLYPALHLPHSDPLTRPLRLPCLSEGSSKGRSAASVPSLAWIIEKPLLPPLNLSPGLLVSADHWPVFCLEEYCFWPHILDFKIGSKTHFLVTISQGFPQFALVAPLPSMPPVLDYQFVLSVTPHFFQGPGEGTVLHDLIL